ncbi:RNA-binding (RRM/RBD/RNP motifs) family protein [Arabidopsis thaliana]|jgi:RNA recognition motif-containing protein|nr:RNA-binding (RRM/RBD/RNP motifs) family protein [Arabidopsis thaliana]ANM60740.1 RNA-binding (RRM/RBD/RNP motifs) family protein [Arabidopsis thaliana]|eukprot:NP_001323004.1 RNA-binding (RRM/RBD/RNP motifs) family protein [Arabidopsis thaliana]
MSYSRRSRYSPSLSPYDKRRGRSVSRSLSRSPTRSVSSDAENPGNSLYVTGLSHRVTERDLEDHFAKEGKVTDVHLVLDPWTRESRGFGFISMKSVGDANRCIRSLDHSVLQGRVITVEKVKRLITSDSFYRTIKNMIWPKLILIYAITRHFDIDFFFSFKIFKLFACFHFQVSVAAGLLFVAAVLHQIANVATVQTHQVSDI